MKLDYDHHLAQQVQKGTYRVAAVEKPTHVEHSCLETQELLELVLDVSGVAQSIVAAQNATA